MSFVCFRRLSYALAVCYSVMAFASSLQAAPPTVRTVDIHGLQAGGKTTLTIAGTDLLPAPTIVLPFAKAQQQLLDKPTATRIQFEVSLPESVIPGTYQIRVANENGISNAVAIAVDRLPQAIFAPKIEARPISLHGTLTGSNILKTTFTGRAGETILFEVEAQRLGGKLRPVIHLYDARRVQLGWALPASRLSGDTRLSVKLPTDGEYTLELHDLQYAAAAPAHFRLKVGNWSFADYVFPPAVQRGQQATLQIPLRSSGARPVPFTAPSITGNVPAPWHDTKSASGPQPRLIVSDHPELIEASLPMSEAARTLPELPTSVNGRIRGLGEEDVYRLAVKPGDKLRFDVQSSRLGSPTDMVLKLRNAQGGQLAINDDAPGTSDPRLDYTVPAKTDSLLVALQDQLGRFGDGCIYRLTVTNQNAATSSAPLVVSFPSDRLNIPRGGSIVLPVLADRPNGDAPVRLTFDTLPPGVQASNSVIPAAANGTLITLTAGDSASPPVVSRLQAVSTSGNRTSETTARLSNHPLATVQPWLQEELAVSTTAGHAFAADWGTVPNDASLVLAGRLEIPVKVSRPADNPGPVRLTLLTSQAPPLVNGRPVPTRVLRVEKAVEIAIGKNDGAVALLVPADLPVVGYELAVKAEFLSKDKKTVLGTAFTPVRKFPTTNPVGIALTGTASLTTAKIKTGATLVVKGSVTRRTKFSSDITVTATGQPAGTRITPAVVKADKNEFQVTLQFPANVAVGSISGIKLSATAKPNPAQANVVVRSNEIPLTVTITETPPAAKPKVGK